jgi:tRNA(fMet)-specific endonuclease VapC
MVDIYWTPILLSRCLLKQLTQATEVFIPSIVLGELYYGARKSARVEANVQRVDELTANSAILVCDTETAQRYGIIKNALRAKGRPLPENDIWVAALAVQHGLVLVSRDAHFNEVEDVVVETW